MHLLEFLKYSLSGRKVFIGIIFSLISSFSSAQTITLEKVHRLGFSPFSTTTTDGKYRVSFDGELVIVKENDDTVTQCGIKQNTRILIEDDFGKIHKPRSLEGACPELTQLIISEDIKGGAHLLLSRFMDGMRYRSSLKKLKYMN